MESEEIMKPDSNRDKPINVRFTQEEYEHIYKRYKSSTCRKMSEYVRNILLNKKTTTLYRNQSVDEFMAEMILLRKELNAIGNNFNQLVRKINACQTASELKAMESESTANQQAVMKKITEIKEHINKFSDRWSQSFTRGSL